MNNAQHHCPGTQQLKNEREMEQFENIMKLRENTHNQFNSFYPTLNHTATQPAPVAGGISPFCIPH